MSTDICNSNETTAVSSDGLALAGNIFPTLDMLWIDQDEAKIVAEQVSRIYHWVDLIFILSVGWLLLPIVEFFYRFIHKYVFDIGFGPTLQPFQSTRLYHVTLVIAQMAQLALVIYLADILDIVRQALRIDLFGSIGSDGDDEGAGSEEPISIPRTLAKLIYIVFATRKLGLFKKHLLIQYVAAPPKKKKLISPTSSGTLKQSDSNIDNYVAPDEFDQKRIQQQREGFVRVIDHFLDGILGIIAAFFVVDILDISGSGLKSAITFGSAGTLAFTLASQSIVAAIVNGFALNASTRFFVGEYVQFGDGTTGTIVKMGWIETTLRGSNDLMISVPNTQLAGQRVSNLSRNKKCQIKQYLRFHYQDMSELPKVCESIKEEIKASCPQLVTDGSRTFRVVISDLCETHIQVLVDVHFTLPPIGNSFWNNKQACLLAIHRAVVEKHQLQFAILQPLGSGGKYAVLPPQQPKKVKHDEDSDAGKGLSWPWKEKE